MKKWTFFLSLVLVLLFAGSALAAAIPQPPADFYCLDQANILSASTEQAVISTGRTLKAQTGAQIVVLTVPTLEDTPISEYALQVLRDWGIGDKTKNNGVLILVAIKERKSRIEVGYGLEGALPDAKTGRIQDEYLIPYFAKGNYDQGIINTYNAILKEINKEYGVSINSIEPGKTNVTASKGAKKHSWLDIVWTIGGLLLMIFLARRGIFIWGPFGGGGFGGGGGGDWGGGGSGGGGGSDRDW